MRFFTSSVSFASLYFLISSINLSIFLLSRKSVTLSFERITHLFLSTLVEIVNVIDYLGDNKTEN